MASAYAHGDGSVNAAQKHTSTHSHTAKRGGERLWGEEGGGADICERSVKSFQGRRTILHHVQMVMHFFRLIGAVARHRISYERSLVDVIAVFPIRCFSVREAYAVSSVCREAYRCVAEPNVCVCAVFRTLEGDAQSSIAMKNPFSGERQKKIDASPPIYFIAEDVRLIESFKCITKIVVRLHKLFYDKISLREHMAAAHTLSRLVFEYCQRCTRESASQFGTAYLVESGARRNGDGLHLGGGGRGGGGLRWKNDSKCILCAPNDNTTDPVIELSAVRPFTEMHLLGRAANVYASTTSVASVDRRQRERL